MRESEENDWREQVRMQREVEGKEKKDKRKRGRERKGDEKERKTAWKLKKSEKNLKK